MMMRTPYLVKFVNIYFHVKSVQFLFGLVYTINMSISARPKDYQVLFLDMNSFFASVEQQVRPELRGKPVGVAPYTGDSGCIIAASIEAKRQGVKICRIGEAKKIIPSMIILEARPSLYMIYHKEIRKVLEKFTPYYEAMSIDEFAIHLTPLDQKYDAVIQLANNIKSAIKKDVGDYLTCSIGVGASKFLAKMAAGSQKPNGLVVLNLNQLEEFYSKLKLTDLTGINFRMEARLNFIGIKSPLEFYNCSLSYLAETLKHGGKNWYYRLRGYEVDNFISQTKTIGHSHVLEPALRSQSAAISVLHKLVFKAGYRLRRENFLAGGVYLSIRFLDGTGFSQSLKTPEFFSDNTTFWQYVELLLKKCHWSGLPAGEAGRPIHLAVGVFNLKKNKGEQISIFAEIEKRKNLAVALDHINDDFGADTVFPASMLEAGDSAPDRIPFGRPRYDILH